MTAEAVPAEPTSRRPRGSAALGLTLLMVLGAFYVFGAVSDLTSDASAGLPTDHTGTFTALSGTSFSNTQGSTPGTARYITLLERGYALHELTFAHRLRHDMIAPICAHIARAQISIPT